jgi:multidrug efflux pump subunit AcrA (membrane-fusion protein)
MKAGLFNQEAVDSWSTPEQLDQQVKVISPGVWILFITVLVGVVTVMVWACIGTISSGQDYEGVIFDHSNVTSIRTEIAGTLQDVLVEEGDTISEGDIIAVIENEQITDLIAQAREQEKKYKKTSAKYQELEQTIAAYTGQTVLRSDVDGTVQKLELAGEAVQAGDEVANIVPDSAYSYNEVYIYVPKEEAGSLQVGMEAQITPAYVSREEYGYMEGIVSQISDNIVTDNSILKHMGTLDYVENLLPSHNCVAVTIQLRVDTEGDGQYVWSNSKGEGLEIKSGDQCDIRILKQEYHPYELLLRG